MVTWNGIIVVNSGQLKKVKECGLTMKHSSQGQNSLLCALQKETGLFIMKELLL